MPDISGGSGSIATVFQQLTPMISEIMNIMITVYMLKMVVGILKEVF